MLFRAIDLLLYVSDYDYTRALFHTEANQWIEVSVPYVVYEMEYGIESVIKQIKFISWSTGSTRMPYYIDSLTVTEHVTDIDMTEASLVTAALGNDAYKAPESETKYWEVNGTQYATWAEAVWISGSTCWLPPFMRE